MLHFKAVDCSSKQKANERRENKTPDAKVICIYCNNALLSERKGSSANLAKPSLMQNTMVSLTQSVRLQEIVWICSYCAEKSTKGDTQEMKLFTRYG